MTVAAVAAAAKGAPRPIWTEHCTESGRPFWYNRQTKQRTWKRPPELTAAAEAPTLPADAIHSAGRRTCGTGGAESGATAAPSARSPPMSSAFYERKSLFDADQRKPRASKLALYAYYAASLEEGGRPPPGKASSKGDADSDSGRPPSESGDTGASGGKNGFILDEEGFWVRCAPHSGHRRARALARCRAATLLAAHGHGAPRQRLASLASDLPRADADRRLLSSSRLNPTLGCVWQTRTDDIEAEYGAAEQLTPVTFKQKFVIRDAPVDALATAAGATDPHLLRQATMGLGLPPALPAGSRRRSSSASSSSSSSGAPAAGPAFAAPAMPLASAVAASRPSAVPAGAAHRAALPSRSQGKEREPLPSPAAPVVEEAEEGEEEDWL